MSSFTSTPLITSAGFIELEVWSCIEVTGADSASFLQNMCTNDVLRLQPGQGCEAFFTDVKGHVLAHVLITCREESLILTRSTPRTADLIGHLDRYILREDVQLWDRSADVRYLFVSGASAGEALVQVTGDPQLPQQLETPLARSPAEIGGVSCALIRFPISLSAWLIECPRIAMEQLTAHLVANGIARCDRKAWDALRIESGFPLDRVDITEQNLPQEVDRNDRAISFKKGCYLGQETVARIDALGHVNQTLVIVKFSGDRIPPHDTNLVVKGKPVGRVSSACFSPRENAPLALAFVRRGHNAVGTQLESEFGTGEVIPG
jgi:folate-binding protein YgfZ